MNKTWDFTEKKCAVCGKTFVICGNWAYVIYSGRQKKPIYFCSWKHVRQYEAEHVPKRKMAASAAHC